jgi:nogalonic acid methyl ester cyclase/aklanonic acid methyl ester cyclase
MTATDLARRALAAFEAGDDGVVDELIHPSHVDHAPEEGSTGPEGVRRSLQWVRDTFGDRRVDIEDLIASGDRVVARVRFSATQIGELYAQPPTGRRFEAEQVHIWRVADGRLVEHWMFRDDIGAMRQLGLAA